MFGILKALLRISKEVKRIREVLEIAHHRELQLHDYAKGYKPISKYSDIEFDVPIKPKLDEYGEPVIIED